MTAQIGRLFDDLADHYDDDPHHALVADELARGCAARALQATTALDVACGTGAATFALVDRLPSVHVVGIDVSPAMVDVARRASDVPGRAARVTWRVGDARVLPFEDRTFDVVVCASSLHFLGASALVEWQRVLRPGGWAAFSLPSAAAFRPGRAVRDVLPDDLPLPETPEAAAATAARAGFVAPVAERLETGDGDGRRTVFLVWAQRDGG